MIKSFAAFAVFALMGMAVVALPSFAPAVQASEAPLLLKGDRLATRVAGLNCSAQVWPDLSASCLRNGASGAIRDARLVQPAAKPVR
jgi:hypothetical protein